MTIKKMHVYFRQFAQQMGMQNVRAILPEQIDILLNTSIIDTTNQLIALHIGATNDRVITDNTKLGQINAFQTLYRVEEIPMYYVYAEDGRPTGYFSFNPAFSKIGRLTNNPKYNTVSIPKKLPEALFITDFSISYKKASKGFPSTGGIPIFEENAFETNYFPVRLIDDAYLADTLNDFILKPSLRSPIIVTYNKDVYDIYIDTFTEGANGYTLINNLLPYNLRFSYIAQPATVKYGEDLLEDNIDCDLPESMHIDIVKHAVDLYRVAVSNSLYSSGQQENAQQRENTRNNYRNEGTRQVQQ